MRRALQERVADALDQLGTEIQRARHWDAPRRDPAWSGLLHQHRSELIQRLRAHVRHPSWETERRLRETLESWEWVYREVRRKPR